jgi:hypothetical protein
MRLSSVALPLIPLAGSLVSAYPTPTGTAHSVFQDGPPDNRADSNVNPTRTPSNYSFAPQSSAIQPEITSKEKSWPSNTAITFKRQVNETRSFE